MKFFHYTAIVAVLTLFASTTHAEELTVSRALICDTPEQVKTLGEAKNNDTLKAAYEKINADKKVCSVANIGFLEGKVVGKVPVKEGTMNIMELMVMGYLIDGHFHPTPPKLQYSGYLVKGEAI